MKNSLREMHTKFLSEDLKEENCIKLVLKGKKRAEIGRIDVVPDRLQFRTFAKIVMTFWIHKMKDFCP